MYSSVRRSFFSLAVVGLGVAFTGCAPQVQSPTLGHSHIIGAAKIQLPKWRPENVTLACPSGDCPDGVGAVIFVHELGDGQMELDRCTASLIAPDRILTNGHCGREFLADRTYFFYRSGNKTQWLQVGPRVFQRFGFEKDEEGLSLDLAVFMLTASVIDIAPRSVSRTLDDVLESPVIYSINQVWGGKSFAQLSLDKAACSIRPHQVVFQGGRDDRGIGLGLYDCPIREGNSGSPVFDKRSNSTVLGLINSFYGFSAGGAGVERFSMLFETMPTDLTLDFAMANRLGCLEIEGLPAPEAICPLRHLDELMFAPLRIAALKAAQELRLDAGFDPLGWSSDVYPMTIESTVKGLLPGMEFRRLSYGAMLIAKPICGQREARKGEVARVSQKIALYQSADGEPVFKIVEASTQTAAFEVPMCSLAIWKAEMDRLHSDIQMSISEVPVGITL